MFGECHAHIFMNGVDYQKAVRTHQLRPDEKVIREHLSEYQKRGITYVRDGGDHYGASALARKLAPEYGITYRTPVFGIHKNGHYGKIVGYGFDTMKEYQELVKKAVSQQADFIKIMTTGLMDFDNHGKVTGTALEKEEVREMIHIAHEEGMAVMSHTNGAKAAADVIEAGVDSLEHGNFMDEDTIRLLSQSETVWVPTTVTVRNLIGEGRFSDEVLCPIWEQNVQNLKLVYELGGHVALGSDAGAYGVLHGKGLCDEYRALHEAVGRTQEVEAWLLDGDRRIKEKF